jgi:hypothetical protein
MHANLPSVTCRLFWFAWPLNYSDRDRPQYIGGNPACIMATVPLVLLVAIVVQDDVQQELCVVR